MGSSQSSPAEEVPINVDGITEMILEEPTVLDLLLATASAAAATGNFKSLLPGCPIKSKDKLKSISRSLPPIMQLQQSPDLTAAIEALGIPCNRFLTWRCDSHKGRLFAATGRLQIPYMPAVYQFVLVQAAPNLENAYAARQRHARSTLLFHGTSLDRLHSILCNGLRVCSGTKLEKNGAWYGKGIYMGMDSLLSAKYAVKATQHPNDFGWRGSALGSVGVLLGVEYYGDPGRELQTWDATRAGEYVVRDPSTLIVRYVWLVDRFTFGNVWLQDVVGRLPLGDRLDEYLEGEGELIWRRRGARRVGERYEYRSARDPYTDGYY